MLNKILIFLCAFSVISLIASQFLPNGKKRLVALPETVLTSYCEREFAEKNLYEKCVTDKSFIEAYILDQDTLAKQIEDPKYIFKNEFDQYQKLSSDWIGEFDDQNIVSIKSLKKLQEFNMRASQFYTESDASDIYNSHYIINGVIRKSTINQEDKFIITPEFLYNSVEVNGLIVIDNVNLGVDLIENIKNCDMFTSYWHRMGKLERSAEEHSCFGSFIVSLTSKKYSSTNLISTKVTLNGLKMVPKTLEQIHNSEIKSRNMFVNNIISEHVRDFCTSFLDNIHQPIFLEKKPSKTKGLQRWFNEEWVRVD